MTRSPRAFSLSGCIFLRGRLLQANAAVFCQVYAEKFRESSALLFSHLEKPRETTVLEKPKRGNAWEMRTNLRWNIMQYKTRAQDCMARKSMQYLGFLDLPGGIRVRDTQFAHKC